MASVSWIGSSTRGTTPHNSARRRRTSWLGEKATTGTRGRKCESSRAVVPESVKAAINEAPASSAAWHAAAAITSGNEAGVWKLEGVKRRPEVEVRAAD